MLLRTPARHLAAWLFAAGAATGCQLVLGSDPVQCARDEDCPTSVGPLVCMDGLCVEGEPGSTSSVGTEASTSTGEPACDSTSECLPAAPAGWSGPVLATFNRDAPAACPSSAPTPVKSGYAELDAADAVCGCECEEINTDKSCRVTVFAGSECADTIPWTLREDDCETLYVIALPPGSEAVFPASFDACRPAPAQEVPSVARSEHVQLCEAPASECDDGVCVPTSDGVPQCIYREGDTVCPGPAYPLRYIYYAGVEDDRRCSPCTCGEQTACKLRIYADASCMGEHLFETPLDEEMCISITDIIPTQFTTIGGLSSRIDPGPGVCEASTSAPAGAAIRSEAFTLCCRS